MKPISATALAQIIVISHLTFKEVQLKRGMGYWKLNNSHLHDEEFVSKVNLIINETVNSSYDSYAALWDVIKFKIKDYAIIRCQNEKRYLRR